jgi:hypothetical protein
MRPSLVFVALITFLSNNIVTAQQVTDPIRYTWIATSCETWNCAASALVLANGEPNVIVLPTNVPELPWLILRRVEEGSIYIPETESFGCNVFAEISAATANYGGVESCRKPMLLTVPDGRTVVIALNNCKQQGRRRAVR